MTDQTLLGVLNILRMDEGQGHSFMVKAILPDGKPRLVRLKSALSHRLSNIVENNSRMLCFIFTIVPQCLVVRVRLFGLSCCRIFCV